MPANTFPSAAAPACDGETYTVQGGDWCVTISQAQGISVAELQARNPSINADCTNLEPGQTLCLGGGELPCRAAVRALGALGAHYH